MPNFMSGNWINVGPGDPAFNVLSNFTNYFELGDRAGKDFWLEGDIVGPADQPEFLFNGRLFMSNGQQGAVIDNFPKSVPQGWTRRQAGDGSGYDLLDHGGEVLFGFRVDRDRICHVVVNLYAADGSVVAHGGQEGFVVHRGPTRLGRGGIRIG